MQHAGRIWFRIGKHRLQNGHYNEESCKSPTHVQWYVSIYLYILINFICNFSLILISDRRQWTAIIVLSVILVIVILLFILLWSFYILPLVFFIMHKYKQYIYTLTAKKEVPIMKLTAILFVLKQKVPLVGFSTTVVVYYMYSYCCEMYLYYNWVI